MRLILLLLLFPLAAAHPTDAAEFNEVHYNLAVNGYVGLEKQGIGFTGPVDGLVSISAHNHGDHRIWIEPFVDDDAVRLWAVDPGQTRNVHFVANGTVFLDVWSDSADVDLLSFFADHDGQCSPCLPKKAHPSVPGGQTVHRMEAATVHDARLVGLQALRAVDAAGLVVEHAEAVDGAATVRGGEHVLIEYDSLDEGAYRALRNEEGLEAADAAATLQPVEPANVESPGLGLLGLLVVLAAIARRSR